MTTTAAESKFTLRSGRASADFGPRKTHADRHCHLSSQCLVRCTSRKCTEGLRVRGERSDHVSDAAVFWRINNTSGSGDEPGIP